MIDECGSIHSFALMAKPNCFKSDQSRLAVITVNGQTFSGVDPERIWNLEQAIRDGRTYLATKAEQAVLKAKGLIRPHS